MKLLFGKKLCSACQDKKKEFDKAGIEYKYFDLETSEGLSKAAFYGVLHKPLPVVIEVNKSKQVNWMNERW